MSALLGKKVGMTGIFDEQGQYVPVTVIQVGPCYVTQVKTKATDGYDAVQLGYEEMEERKLNKPETGHFAKSGVSPKRYLKEVRSFDDEKFASMKPGTELKAEEIFNEGDTVHVVSQSKGRGFQGVVKRHHFGGVGQATHGQSDRQRHQDPSARRAIHHASSRASAWLDVWVASRSQPVILRLSASLQIRI